MATAGAFIQRRTSVLVALLGVGLSMANWGDYFRSDDFVFIDGVQSTSFRSLLTGENLAGFPFYRPAVLVGFWLERKLWGLEPLGYHLTNVFLCFTAVVLLYHTLELLFRDRGIATVASILMVVHPAHTETVSWISGRTDLMCGVFMLAALYCFARFRCPESRGWRFYLMSVAAALIALGSKESAIMLPLVLLAADLLREGPRPRSREVLIYLPFLLSALGYLAVRTLVLRGIGGYGLTHFGMGLFVARNFVRYAQFFAVPVDLTSYATFFVRHQVGLLLVLVVLVGTAVYYLRTPLRSRASLWGIVLSVLAFVPIGNLAPDNRHAYAIYMGLAVLAASLAVHLVRKEGRNRRLGVAALVLWGLLLAGFAARASLNARTAAQLSRKIVAQSAALLDGGGAPIRFVALTVPDSYRGAFVLRNGLHQALRLVRPDRQVQALSCTLIGINDLTVPGIGITAQDGASYTVQILPGRNAYILLPIALWTRRTGESITIGPVTYRIVEKEGLFQVTKIHMRFEERFVDQLGVVLAAFVGGNMTLFDKPK